MDADICCNQTCANLLICGAKQCTWPFKRDLWVHILALLLSWILTGTTHSWDLSLCSNMCLHLLKMIISGEIIINSQLRHISQSVHFFSVLVPPLHRPSATSCLFISFLLLLFFFLSPAHCHWRPDTPRLSGGRCIPSWSPRSPRTTAGPGCLRRQSQYTGSLQRKHSPTSSLWTSLRDCCS